VRHAAFDSEIALAKELILSGDLQQSFRHLARAHVMGQAFVGPHARSHWLMLKVEIRRRRSLAVCGQALRIVLGVIGSSAGVVPVGNTGGTDIGMFKRLPIKPELQSIIDSGSAPGPRA
jgi:hypothetical protein